MDENIEQCDERKAYKELNFTWYLVYVETMIVPGGKDE